MAQDANPNVHVLHLLPHRLNGRLDSDQRRGIRHPPALVLGGLLGGVETVGEVRQLLVLPPHRRRQVGVLGAERFQPIRGIAVLPEGLDVLAAGSVEDRVLLGQEALLDGGNVAGDVLEALFDVSGGRGVVQEITLQLDGVGGGGGRGRRRQRDRRRRCEIIHLHIATETQGEAEGRLLLATTS